MACVDAHSRNVLKKAPLIDTRNVPCGTPSKAASKPAAPRNGGENRDPLGHASGLGATVSNKCPGVSRIPVPVKSQHLKTLTDATQVQRKPQDTTKNKLQKKSCTKPVPFNLSQPRTARSAATGQGKPPAGQNPAAPQPGPGAGSRTAKAPSVAHSLSTTVSSGGSDKLGIVRTVDSSSLPGQTSPPDSTVCQALPLGHSTASSLPGQTSPPDSTVCQALPLGHSTASSRTSPPIPCTLQPSTQFGPPCQATADRSNPAVQKPLIPPVAQTVLPSGCLKPPNNQVSPPEAGGTADGSRGSQTSSQDSTKSSQMSAGPAVTFCPDPTAVPLRPAPSPGATPRLSANTPREGGVYLPQRVPVRGRRGGAPDTGNAMLFSPDPAALMSILRNEGVRAGETLRGSVCSMGRSSSNYLPQRVPITRSRHATGLLAGPPLAESISTRTPTIRWTPQRVPNTRPQSMLHLTHRTPILRRTPKLESIQGFSSALTSCKEVNVVQRLFEDVEEEEVIVVHSERKNTDFQKDGFSEPKATVFPSAEAETGPVEGVGPTDKPCKGQPFVQALHRGSVIVFTQGGKVLHSPGPTEGLQVQQANSSTAPRDPPVHGPGHARLRAFASPGGALQRPARMGLAASALRRRLQPLEEILLDEECAMYTCQPSASMQPLRSGNPVATTLHFKDSMCFAPVSLPSLSFG
ncbi:nascent polypeptide-associated complex subunit alpha, muscle-specific form [Brienomyrus brachyistius]|uniref:nascent polypeptide-associated complex subunit alpha, muscle-specific form n=1 Tax=Brienomyrus brachyistius TaxID=42636 RepID=UPI0020B2CF5E|nr:nascent polypeptide-associated complex subunit alpha, muscle-specific form [Brienomyrus brachyistius]